MTSCWKNDCCNPPGKSIYLKFRHNLSKRHKRDVRNFGDSRWKGSRGLAVCVMARVRKPPPPVSYRVKGGEVVWGTGWSRVSFQFNSTTCFNYQVIHTVVFTGRPLSIFGINIFSASFYHDDEKILLNNFSVIVFLDGTTIKPRNWSWISPSTRKRSSSPGV